jgi:four helix bundle protein
MIQDSGFKNSKIKEFTDLFAWKEGHKLVLLIYRCTKLFPKEELYSLVDQIQRAAISITSNIAEGFGRQTYKEKVQFYYQAQGSLTELKNQLFIARDVGYLNIEQFNTLNEQANLTHQLLQGLISKSKTYILKRNS